MSALSPSATSERSGLPTGRSTDQLLEEEQARSVSGLAPEQPQDVVVTVLAQGVADTDNDDSTSGQNDDDEYKPPRPPSVDDDPAEETPPPKDRATWTVDKTSSLVELAKSGKVPRPQRVETMTNINQDDLTKVVVEPTFSERLREVVAKLPQVVILPLLIGSVFGAALQRGKIHEFYFVRQQMIWEKHLMLKMFLAAAATSVLVIALLRRFGSTAARLNLNTTSSWMTTKPGRGLPATLLGCFLVGVSFPISGSCPGTVFSQLGAGSVQARLIVAGALIGAIIFYGVHSASSHLADFLQYAKIPNDKSSIPALLGLNYYVVAAGLSLGMAGLVLLFELLYPWQEEVKSLYPAEDATWERSLPGGLAGVAIGLLQFPLITLLSNHLGCSSSYCTVSANALFFWKGSNEWQLTRANWWQVFLVLGMVLGSFVSSVAADESFQSDHTVSDTEAILGGILFVIGARLAAGCTSGHGISGVGYLSTQSLLGTAAMFGGGLASGFALYT